MYYVVDRRGRLWWGADTEEQCDQTLRSQGYTIVKLNPNKTWEYV